MKICSISYFMFKLITCFLYLSMTNIYFGRSEVNGESHLDPVKMFQNSLLHVRKEHKKALQTLLAMNDYIKQYKMIDIIAVKSFQVLEESQTTLRNSGYVPGMEFPSDQNLLLALGQNIETTMFFGEILLHLPDITHKIINTNKPWQLLLTWGIFFASQSNFLDDSSKKLIALMSQEMELSEKDPYYINPYRSVNKKGHWDTGLVDKVKEKKKKKNFKKGPTLSRNFGDL